MLRKLLAKFYLFFLKRRYTLVVSGENYLEKGKQYVFFANHQALVDPQIVTSLLESKSIPISPLMTETFYYIPGLQWIFQWIGAIPIKDIQRNSGSKHDIEHSLQIIGKAIKNKKNILIYPAGQLYTQGYEAIRGKKIAYEVFKMLPHSVEVLGIRTTGLWGSMWSKARNGDTPPFLKTYLYAIFIVFGNLLFFVPKRNVRVEIFPLKKTLSPMRDLHAFNKTLEDLYNVHGEEKVEYLKHFFYWNDVKNKTLPTYIVGSLEIQNTQDYDVYDIPNEVKNKIIQKIATMKEIHQEKILLSSHLIKDLYFDSLDIAEIKSYIQQNFSQADNPPILSLQTVGDLCLMAIGKSSQGKVSFPACNWNTSKQESLAYTQLKTYQEKGASTILDLIVANTSYFHDEVILYDTIFGAQTGKQFLLKCYVFAQVCKRIPDRYIGIMLPSLSSTSILITACYLAGKVPVMFNWTLGERALLHCFENVEVKSIFTSFNFYEKIKNEGTEKIREKFVFLEHIIVKKDFFITKILGAIHFFLRTKPHFSNNDIAVILFTSGSENLPKKVQLTFENILADIEGSLYHFPIKTTDIVISFLPPFHSFGFTVNTLMPLVSGIRVVYTPNPHDAKTIGELIAHTRVTTITATPTFLSMILQQGDSKQLSTIRYAIVGAEKCPEKVFSLFSQICPQGKILEGYGITECSPVISLNPLSKPKQGSVGIPIYGEEIIIGSIDAPVSVYPENQEGMIYVSGKNVFGGYGMPGIEEPFVFIDGKKFYKTGDMGYKDAEGYLYITGRLKRFIKIAGEMISLPFIEEILQQRYENTIAVEAKEFEGTAKIVAFSIYPIPLDEINTYLSSKGVSNLIRIHEVRIIDAFPLLGTGKIDYKVLKNMI